jgi:hypothetical protein
MQRTGQLIINILPLVEGVMVDYHTIEKISHSGKRISPETKSRVILLVEMIVVVALFR